MKRRLSQFVLLLGCLLAAGCGGGGGLGSVSDGNLGLFVTDDLNTGYDSVWVRIHKIELLTASGSVTAFNDTNGVEVDVRALNQGGIEHYAFFGKDDVQEGTYTGVRVTLGKDVVLFPTGQSTGQQRVFASLDANQMKVLSHTYAAPKTLGGAESNIVIDFMLQNWVDDGTFIQNAEIGDGSTLGLSDPDLHEEDDFKGTVHGLSGDAPNQTFTLANNHGTVVAVRTNSATAVFRSDGSPNPTLRDGQKVEVRGTYIPAEEAVLAVAVKIKVDEGEEPEVEGSPFNINSGAGTFDVEIDEAEGFLPVADFVHIVTNADTRYFGDHGVPLTREEFFAGLSAESENEVEVEGPYDSGTNTMTAVKCKLEDEDNEGEVEAEGTASNLDPLAGTFTMTLQEWEGFSGSVGMQVSIATTIETEYEAENDDSGMTKEEFFALLALNPNATVEAEGSFEGDVLVAHKLKLEDVSGEDEAEGEVVSVNGGAFSFEMRLFEWEGFSGSFGLVIDVQTTLTTQFKGPNEEPLTREQFFAELAAGARVEADGVFAAGVLTASEVEIED